MTIQELEKKVWDQDRIRIVVRDRSTAKIGTYTHRNAAQENWRITQFLSSRISPLVRDREVAVLDGQGNLAHGRTLLKTLRQSYN